VFYKITSEGTGVNPTLCSNILVNYSAYRFGYGNAFDSFLDPEGIPFVLGRLIVGVQKVMPLVKAGGSITMYIPPSLAYGSEAQRDQLGNIILPANSYIRFDMSLKAVL
jgi:FKBP-type peptidyl-prolyl cis-trans isomerase